MPKNPPHTQSSPSRRPTGRPVRILLLNSRDIVRRGLRAVVEEAEDLVVVAEARGQDTHWAAIDGAHADVAIIETTEGGPQTVDSVHAMREQDPRIRSVILGHREGPTRRVAIASEADAYFLDDAAEDDVRTVVRRVMLGRRETAPVAESPSTLDPAVSRVELTLRETQVLHLIAEGLTNREIGQRLGLAEKTVKNYTSALFAKLQITHRTQAVLYLLTHDDQA